MSISPVRVTVFVREGFKDVEFVASSLSEAMSMVLPVLEGDRNVLVVRLSEETVIHVPRSIIGSVAYSDVPMTLSENDLTEDAGVDSEDVELAENTEEAGDYEDKKQEG